MKRTQAIAAAADQAENGTQSNSSEESDQEEENIENYTMQSLTDTKNSVELVIFSGILSSLPDQEEMEDQQQLTKRARRGN